MNTENASKLFESLSSPIRLAIFRLLVVAGNRGMVAGDLAKDLNTAPNNLSFHLKQLSQNNMVYSIQEGRFIRYYANLTLMTGLIDFLTESCCRDENSKECRFNYLN